MTEDLLEHSVEQGAILSAIIPSYINGEHVEVLVEARQLDDGSPSEDVRVTVRDADGVELGSQHTQVRLLGNAEEIRRALTSGMPEKKRGICRFGSGANSAQWRSTGWKLANAISSYIYCLSIYHPTICGCLSPPRLFQRNVWHLPP